MEDQWIDACIDRMAAIKHRKLTLCLLIICSRYQVVEDSGTMEVGDAEDNDDEGVHGAGSH
jgi:hypothetical protein